MSDDHVPHIVVTGGPCAGKTSCLAYASEKLPDYGITPLFIPEVATMIFGSGFKIADILKDKNKMRAFQRQMLISQRDMEKNWREFARIMPAKKKVLIGDRGAMDNEAYIGKIEFESIANELGVTLAEIMNRQYDAVLCLVTAADGAEEFYDLKSNPMRYEKPEEARALDKRIQNAWIGHEHLRIINNFELNEQGEKVKIDFETKKKRMMKELCRALHIPVPLEIERKYLVSANTNPETLPVHAVPVEIRQTYLKRDHSGSTRRIRETRTLGNSDFYGDSIYTYTEKVDVNALVRQETERIVGEREYLAKLQDRDPSMREVVKKRYSFIDNGQYFQLDILTEPQKLILLEIELTEETDKLKLPDFIKIKREVTDDRRYSNASIAYGGCPGYR